MARAKTPKQLDIKIKSLKKQLKVLEVKKEKALVVKKKVVKKKAVKRKPAKRKKVVKKKRR